ncbi:MAG: hypothetical protein DESF_00048 [Desulfovibrio sp.]
MQGGPRRGRSPITGPALPHAAQAANRTAIENLPSRRATAHSAKKKTFPSLPAPIPQGGCLHKSATANKLLPLCGAPQAGRHSTAFMQSKSARWHCAPRREITRPKGGKLPEHKARSPRQPGEVENLKGVLRGGMQGGPRRGRSPITGPALPHAAQAANRTEAENLPSRRATAHRAKNKSSLPFLPSPRRRPKEHILKISHPAGRQPSQVNNCEQAVAALWRPPSWQTLHGLHAEQERTMALRAAQGDHPTEGREAPGAQGAQPSPTGGS